MTDIDNEWELFLQNDGNDDDDDGDDDDGDDDDDDDDGIIEKCPLKSENNRDILHLNNVSNVPKCSELYISTKTIISYLNVNDIDIKNIFWKIQVLKYYTPNNGIIKKQIKYTSTCKEEVEYITEQLKDTTCYEEHIIEHIDNPEGRIKYKDQRKISVGTCKKDLLSYKSKQKRAFFNCFVLILRLFYNDEFKEIHIKVFNTGKLEIPGIQSDEILYKVLDLLILVLRPYIGDDLKYEFQKNETVLINSNFNCGFYIDRDKLHDLLKYKYRINSNFDACSYPGIQSKFYYDNTADIQNGQQPSHKNYEEVSFMIFRTGSVLIVGKCDEHILYYIYNFIKNLLVCEYDNINSNGITIQTENISRNKKVRKKMIYVDNILSK